MNTYYDFTVRGNYQNGNKAQITGYVCDEPDYPASAFDKAVKTCEDLTPGLIVDRANPGTVSLRKLSRKPRNLKWRKRRELLLNLDAD